MMMRVCVTAVAGLVLAGSAAAIDCSKATKEVDKAICADPALKATDDAMAAAYEAVLPKLEAKQQAALKASQIAWLTLRDGNCTTPSDTPVEPGQPGLCIKEITENRTNFLTAKVESGPGPATALIPYVVSNPMAPKSCSEDAALHVFPGSASGAGVTAFNAAVMKIMADVKKDNSTRESPDYECSWQLTSTLTYASPDLTAASIMEDIYGGGAHGNYARVPVLVDMKTGKSPSYGDIFPASAKDTLVKACTDSLFTEKKKRNTEYQGATPEDTKAYLDGLPEEMKGYADTIASYVVDMSHWLVYADRAEVYFAPYDVGSFADGDFTCTLPKELLKTASAGKWIVP